MTAAADFSIDEDVLYPRDAEHRYRIYARRGRGRAQELEVLAVTPDAGGIGAALVQIDEDQASVGRRLVDLGAIGVLDAVSGRWILMPWHRTEEVTRLRETEVTL